MTRMSLEYAERSSSDIHGVVCHPSPDRVNSRIAPSIFRFLRFSVSCDYARHPFR